MKRRIATVAVITVAGLCLAAHTNRTGQLRFRLERKTITDKRGQNVHALKIEDFTNVVTTVSGFTNLLCRLPENSVLSYTAGYAQFYVPLGTNRFELEEFGSMCASNGVKFSAIVPDL